MSSPSSTATAASLRKSCRRSSSPLPADAPILSSGRSEEHTSELQSPCNLVCRLLLEKKKKKKSGTCRRTTTYITKKWMVMRYTRDEGWRVYTKKKRDNLRLNVCISINTE